jgi:hypothetical protein
MRGLSTMWCPQACRRLRSVERLAQTTNAREEHQEGGVHRQMTACEATRRMWKLHLRDGTGGETRPVMWRKPRVRKQQARTRRKGQVPPTTLFPSPNPHAWQSDEGLVNDRPLLRQAPLTASHRAGVVTANCVASRDPRPRFQRRG